MTDTPTGTPGTSGTLGTTSGDWVVGVDGSEGSRHAALWATAHARDRAERLRFVSAWHIPSAPALPPIGPMHKYWNIEAYEADALASVEQLASDLRSTSPVPIETSLVKGPVADVLIGAARHGSLLVVGCRGLGGFSRLVLGSTSTQCATHAPVPVAVIPDVAPADSTGHIVVAFDGSQNSIDALAWTLEFAAPDADIECVGVWDIAPVAIGINQYYIPESNEAAQDEFEGLLDRCIDELGADRSAIRRSFVEGRTRQEVANAASDADLLVMGARGHGAVASHLLGSVSTWLLHHVERPMVVVPHRSSTD